MQPRSISTIVLLSTSWVRPTIRLCVSQDLPASQTGAKLLPIRTVKDSEVSRMLDALRQNEATVNATLIQAQYQVDAAAVAEAIVQRAWLLRRLRVEFESAGEREAVSDGEVLVAGD